MESASTRSPKRLLRVLLAGGILALGWVAFDTVAHSEPAAAAETIDLLPVGDDALDTVGALLDSVVTEVVAPVVTPIAEPVVDSVVTPVLTPIVTPVVEKIVAPIGEAISPVTDPLAPVLTPILTAVLEPVAPVLAVIPTIETATDAVQALPAMTAITPNGTILAAGGAVIVSVALVAVAVPLLPAPAGGGPLNAPLAPAAPSGSTGSPLAAIYGELNSGLLAGFGAFGTAGAQVAGPPSPPTFDSDTTPD